MKLCSYCQQVECRCGANDYAEPKENHRRKSEPFAYNGYIVWPLRDYLSDKMEFYFYLGMDLIDIVEITRQALYDAVEPGSDAMPFIWGLFELTQGWEDTFEFSGNPDKWNRRPIFEITMKDRQP